MFCFEFYSEVMSTDYEVSDWLAEGSGLPAIGPGSLTVDLAGRSYRLGRLGNDDVMEPKQLRLGDDQGHFISKHYKSL